METTQKIPTAETYYRDNYSSWYDENNDRITHLSDAHDAMEEYAQLREKAIVSEAVDLLKCEKFHLEDIPIKDRTNNQTDRLNNILTFIRVHNLTISKQK